MKKITPKQYAISLYEILKEAKDPSVVIKNFVRLLVKNNDLRQADRILDYFEKYRNEQKGKVAVEVTTARKLSSEELQRIGDYFKKSLKKEIELKVHQDKSLIGGVVLKFNDTLLDGGIKSQLLNLKESF